MMFQLSDDGVVSSVNEDDLIYVDKNELEKFLESYQELEKENEQLKNEITRLEVIVEKLKNNDFDIFVANMEDLQKTNEEIRKENKQLKQRIKKLKKDVDALSCGEANWLIEEEL